MKAASIQRAISSRAGSGHPAYEQRVGRVPSRGGTYDVMHSSFPAVEVWLRALRFWVCAGLALPLLIWVHRAAGAQPPGGRGQVPLDLSTPIGGSMTGRLETLLPAEFNPTNLVRGAGKKLSFEQARALATNICSQCHLFPDPILHQRSTWKEKVEPWMRAKLGVTAIEKDPSPNARILMEEWNAIWNDYYFATAPEKALPQDPRSPIVADLSLFKVEDPHYAPTNCFATLIHIDREAQQVYVGNAITKTLDILDAKGKLVSSTPVDSTLVHLLKRPEGWIGTQIGYVPPSDVPLGLVTLYQKTGNGFEKVRDLITGLVRPVHTAAAELVQPGRTDLLVCSFGNNDGRLARYAPTGLGKYDEDILFERAGSLKSIIVDANHDGKPDIVVLTAQAKEGVFLYLNKGNGEFVEKPLIQQPPVWGYVYFELADFNGDGYPDILTANGDLGDFTCPPKRYHGVRIYLNDGNWNFKEAWFYPLNGAFKAVAADFEGNGRLDIAAISYFPDYDKSPEESFVFLENMGGLKFKAHTFPDCARGRWLVMDVGDLDGDGDLDIVLGGAYKVPFPVPQELKNRWAKEGPSALILRNQLAERKTKATEKK